jgi:hypothetical protein
MRRKDIVLTERLSILNMADVVPQSLIQDLNNRGNELVGQGKYQDAVAEYEQALGLLFAGLFLTRNRFCSVGSVDSLE